MSLTNQQKLLSLVTVTFNNFDELVTTVNSVKPLYPNLEHLIINGGSCLETKEYLNSLSNEYSNVLAISEPDQGIYDAFNKGVRNSTGKFIVFLNSGDYLIDQQYYKKAVDQLFKNKTLDFIHSSLTFDHEKYGKYSLHPLKNGNPALGMPYLHPTMVLRKSLFDQYGLFDESFSISGDFDWTCRILKKPLKTIYLPLTPIVMNNRGVSSQREYQAILECKRSLIRNNLYKNLNKVFFNYRLSKFILRRLLGAMDFLHLGKIYKRQKKV